jgi:two-component system, cell cycle response regulator
MDTQYETPVQPRLLLVDDDPAMIRIIGEMLAEFPNQRFAMSGEAALSLARESTPDLILLDANLPNMTGFDVCELLKKDARLARVPVIFVTSHDAPALEVDAFRMGAADYVIKPLIAARLQARVRAQLRLRQTARTHAPVAAEEASSRVLAILTADSTSTYRDALEGIGALDVAADCASALQIAKEQAPGAFVIDAQQAGSIDTAIQTLRQAYPHVPVIVLTDARDIETEQRTLDAGAIDIVVKPARPSVLQARVRAALASAFVAHQSVRESREAANPASVHPFPGATR